MSRWPETPMEKTQVVRHVDDPLNPHRTPPSRHSRAASQIAHDRERRQKQWEEEFNTRDGLYGNVTAWQALGAFADSYEHVLQRVTDLRKRIDDTLMNPSDQTREDLRRPTMFQALALIGEVIEISDRLQKLLTEVAVDEDLLSKIDISRLLGVHQMTVARWTAKED